jgi:hypothetical protein
LIFQKISSPYISCDIISCDEKFQFRNWPSNTQKKKKKKEGKIRAKKKKRLITYFTRNKNILVRVAAKWRKKYYCVANGWFLEGKKEVYERDNKNKVCINICVFLKYYFSC